MGYHSAEIPSSQVIVGCIKVTIKVNQHTWQSTAAGKDSEETKITVSRGVEMMFQIARTIHPFSDTVSYETIEFILLAVVTPFDFWDVIYLSLLSWIPFQSFKIVLLCLHEILILEDSKDSILIPLLLSVSVLTHCMIPFCPIASCFLC